MAEGNRRDAESAEKRGGSEGLEGLRPEYDRSVLGKDLRGKYFARCHEGCNLVIEASRPDSESLTVTE